MWTQGGSETVCRPRSCLFCLWKRRAPVRFAGAVVLQEANGTLFPPGLPQKDSKRAHPKSQAARDHKYGRPSAAGPAQTMIPAAIVSSVSRETSKMTWFERDGPGRHRERPLCAGRKCMVPRGLIHRLRARPGTNPRVFRGRRLPVQFLNLKLVTDFGACFFGRTSRQLDHAASPPAHRHAGTLHVRNDLRHALVAVNEKNVYRKVHPKRVDRLAWYDPQTFSLGQTLRWRRRRPLRRVAAVSATVIASPRTTCFELLRIATLVISTAIGRTNACFR